METHNREFSKHSKNSAVIMFCTAASRLLGIVRISMVSRIFGAGGVADVINFTFNIPNNFRKLLAEGALSSAFIPTLTKAIDDHRRDVYLFRQMLFLQLIIFIPLIVLSFVFSRQIIGFLSDFDSIQALELATSLLPLFVIYLALVSVVSVINAVLNTNGLFVLAAAAPLSYSIGVIASLFFFSDTLGAFSFPLGVLAGGMIQTILLVFRIRSIGYSIRPALSLKSDYMKQVGMHYLPVMTASLITIASQQFTFFLASGLETGSITTFSNAIIFYQLPYGLFYNSAATAYFPSVSRSFLKRDRLQSSQLISQSVGYLFVFLLPSAILLFLLSRQLVASILLRGAYSIEDALLTAKIVRMFAIGLFPTALFALLQRFLYASGHFRLSLRITGVVAAADALLSFIFILYGYDVSFLAFAHAFTFAVGSVYLVFLFSRKKLAQVHFTSALKQAVKIILLNIPMTLFLIFTADRLGSYWQDGASIRTIAVTAGVSIAAGGILVLSYVIGKVDHITVLLPGRNKQ
jgi:putative peptidoglycan lipid II flippase